MKKTAYEGLMELGAEFDSGEEDRSERHREIFVAKIDRKRRSARKQAR